MNCDCNYEPLEIALAINCCNICKDSKKLVCKNGKKLTKQDKNNLLRPILWKHWHCKDCLLCKSKWHMQFHSEQGCYMLHNDVWLSVASFDATLCELCFEKRLGRQLTIKDYSAAPVNSIS